MTADDTAAVVLTGWFTLGGVALTAIAGGGGAIARRWWAAKDSEADEKRRTSAELRALRRTEYAALLQSFTALTNALVVMNERVMNKSRPQVAMDRILDFLDENDIDVEPLEARILGVELLASEDLAAAVRHLDREMVQRLPGCCRGEKVDWESYDEQLRVVKRLMRSELQAD